MKTIKKLLITVAVLLCSVTANAYDFEVDGIYYSILSASDLTVRVTSGDNKYIGEVIIPSTVTCKSRTFSVISIENGAFYFSDLTSVTIPNSVTSIGDYAFYGCTGLTSITIPNSVTSIGDYAFLGCTGLISIVVDGNNTKYDSRENCNAIIETETNTLIAGCKNTIIPNSVTSIGNSAFRGCTGLTSITIPNSVTSIGNNAFYGCTALNEVNISDLAAWCYIDFGNYDANPLSYRDNLYLNGEKITELIIPEDVTEIKSLAFYGCSGLTSVHFSNSVESIGDETFSDCSGLNDITIPNSVTSIGNSAFRSCTGLTSITIPNSVTSIGNNAFYGCTALNEVNISDLAAWCYIDFGNYDANPLSYRDNLYLNGEKITELIIPEDVTEIKNLAFYGCSGLTSVHFSNSVESIGDETFSDCSGLNDITIPDGIRTIGASAFKGCSNAETLYISNTIESIGENAFAKCNNLYEIKIGSKKAITANKNIFSSDAYNNACLFVPIGRKDFYAKTSPWSNFIIREMDFTGIDEVYNEIKGENGNWDSESVYYDLNGNVVENPTNGIYIIDGNKVFIK